ncbi:MAG: alpha/beta hydrolase [Acidobacteriota bacterium]|nr:alpha/beta hydrolase [Acidobacteriota bacterium]
MSARTIRSILSLSLASLFLTSAPALAQSCPELQVRNPHGNYIVPGVRGDIRYAGDLSLDAYAQPNASRRASVVVIHGGAWSTGSRSAHVGQLLETITRAGYNWFSVDYRLGGLTRFEEALEDLRSALAFIRCRAGEFGVDGDRLVLAGEDSGAHLASLIAAERPPGVLGAVLIGGFYDLAAIPALARTADKGLLARASPVLRQPPPPLLVIHGSADDEAPPEQARRYCGRVAANGGTCRFVDVAGASHRSENWWPGQWTYKRDIVEWLATLGGTPATPAVWRSANLLKDIVFSPSTQLKLDAFLPAASAAVPAVIVVHGGGWEAGDKVTYVTPILEPLAQAGLAWFSIDYRLTPAFTNADQLEDVRQAIRFVRAEHRRFNIDPARVVLLGESASGQMVTQVAVDDPSIAGVVSFYGVYDFPAMVSDASPRSLLVRLFHRSVLDAQSRAELQRYSPLYRAHKEMPPVLMVNGTGERLWIQAQAFAARLKELGARHDVIALEGAPHGMENWEGHAEWMSYKRRVVEWILGVTKKG